jgi:hypothetical protein
MVLRISYPRFKTRFGTVLLLTALFAAPGIESHAKPAAPPPGATGQSASSAPQAAPMSKAQVLALLYKLYDQAYHFGDAVAKLPAADWKFGGKKKQVFYDKAATVRAGVTELRKPWDAFYKQPDDPSLGRATLSAIKSVSGEMNEFIAALGDTPGASQVSDFKPLAEAVADEDHQLEPYVTYLQASAQPPAATQPPASTAEAAASTTNAPAAGNPAGHAEAPAPAAANASNPPASSNPQPAPAAEVPAGQPRATPVAMQPAEVQALLYKIYTAAFRIGDLAGSLQTDKWALSSQDQAAFSAKVDALRAALAAAEKARSDFYVHPDDAELGRIADSALQAVTPKFDEFMAALSSTPGSASASDFKQADADLTDLDQQLDPYVAYLAEREQPASPAGAAGVETEVVKTPEAVAPLSSGIAEAAPADQEQVKAMLFKAYVPAFRLKDMLTQEHPEQWHASDADRAAFTDASKALSDRIDELAKWRDQLESHPDSLEAAFEAYASLGKLVEPADAVGKIVGQYGNPKIGAEYGQDAEQVEESRDQLEPYLDYLLRHHDHTVGAIERDFVACESQLGYAMRPSAQQAVSMKNINPVFRGRGRSTSRAGRSEKKAPAHAKEKKPAPAAAPAPH